MHGALSEPAPGWRTRFGSGPDTPSADQPPYAPGLGGLDLGRLALRREVKIRLRLGVVRLEVALLATEGVEQALESIDDAARPEY